MGRGSVRFQVSKALEGLTEMAVGKYLKKVRETATQLFGGRIFSAELNRKQRT